MPIQLESQHDTDKGIPPATGSGAERLSKSKRAGLLGGTLDRVTPSALLIVFVVMCGGLAIVSPTFRTRGNVINVARQISILGITATGMTILIIGGDVDLSIGSVYGLSGILCGMLLRDTRNVWLAMLAGLLAGIVVGLLNGSLVTRFRVPAFLVTLGTLNVVRGATLVITGAFPLVFGTLGIPQSVLDTFYFFGQTRLWGVLPMQFVFMATVMALGIVLLHHTPFGFHVFAVGGSSKAARISGINVSRVKIVAFAISGFLSALAGILASSFIGNAQPVAGQGLELDALAATIIGGTPFTGGEGSLWGTLLGVALIGVLRNGLVLLGIGPFWQQVVIGMVLIISVVAPRLR